jgi:hypothetical protein
MLRGILLHTSREIAPEILRSCKLAALPITSRPNNPQDQ